MIKNILVTGGAGYIGSHIIEILIKKNKNVFIIDNLTTGYKKLINKKAKFFKLDVLNTIKLKKIIEKNNIDTIIHLAANLIIGEGEKQPKKYYKNNVKGTQSVLDSIKKTKVKNLLFSSTAAIYKDGMYRVTEKSIVKPKSVYGKTKLKAENLIKTKCKKLGINYGILRYFNIVGASPSGKYGLINTSDHLFKNFSKQVMKKKPILKIYGTDYNTPDGSCIRDFIHVSDIAEIHERVLNKINNFNISVILNCGYNQGISVLQVAKEFKNQSKKKVEIIKVRKRPGDLGKIIASNTKLNNFIKWKPKFKSLSYMVKSSILWEKKLLK
ncbi:MAG: UDP-glucose 4-epimerase GalE [Candidatus Pelagibacter bacterium]|nr:UDP-glucose 4-epimerase GalE [Candidatus Pelagibacter bacterium]